MHKRFTDLLAQPIAGKVVLVRVDFNVPIKDGVVTDSTRIKASLETIQSLLEKQAKVVLVSHLSRPGGKVDDAKRLDPVQLVLQDLLNKPVVKLNEAIGPSVAKAIKNLNAAEVMLLENIRFYPEEEANDSEFAKTLASYCDYFVQDAFGAVHRQHASTYGVAQFLPSYPGCLLDKELKYLSGMLNSPQRPFTAIIGGAKISSKFSVLKHLLKTVDVMILGGAMVYTLLKAQGVPVGRSLVEDDLIPDAITFLSEVKKLNKTLYLPKDHLVVTDFNDPSTARVTDLISSDDIGVDIGNQAIDDICELIHSSRCVLWNGPVGIFETSEYSNGTFAIAKALAQAKETTTVVGGGDSIAALNLSGYSKSIDHISTGGGASLEFLEGKLLPGISVLK
ncbi:MAG: phosphoglycerate kinase [Candidatus Margulisiibacteriota bacterium]